MKQKQQKSKPDLLKTSARKKENQTLFPISTKKILDCINLPLTGINPKQQLLGVL